MMATETRKIIDGAVYDINKAEMICLGSNMSFAYEPTLNEIEYHVTSIGGLVVECLYLAENGQYFIYGIGGNCSKYAEKYVTGRGEGSDIWLIDEEDIASWAEEYNLVDIFLKFSKGAE